LLLSLITGFFLFPFPIGSCCLAPPRFLFLVALFPAFYKAEIGFLLLALVTATERVIGLAPFSRALEMPKSLLLRTGTNKEAR
jgi:hypothetical protein